MIPSRSKLNGIPMNVLPPISEFTQRRTSSITYERGPTKVFGIARGEQGLRVRAKIYNDTDLDSLRELFRDIGIGTVQFDSAQRPNYAGIYIPRDLEVSDSTMASVNAEVSFELVRSDESYYTVETLANDFSITESDTGFLLGVPWWQELELPSGYAVEFEWKLIAAGDGDEGIVTLYSITGDDGTVPIGLQRTSGEYPNDPDDDDSYAQVTTLPNDFSITSSSAPWLWGYNPSVLTAEVVHGPTFAPDATQPYWELTAAGDSTTATVRILRTTSADGPFLIRGDS